MAEDHGGDSQDQPQPDDMTDDELRQHFQERDYSIPYALPVERIIPDFPSFTERYFEPFFFVPSQPVATAKQAGDQCVLFHSNRICMITLAPHHPILAEKKVVKSIDFEGEHMSSNRLMNQVSGKRKRGGQKLKERSVICRINCQDESSHCMLSSIKGTLVEINSQLLEEPQLITQDPYGRGYIAIVITRLDRVKPIKEALLSKEAYDRIVSERTQVKELVESRGDTPAEKSSSSDSKKFKTGHEMNDGETSHHKQ